MTMPVVVDHLTNGAYGFGRRGGPRRVKPIALACIHITGNGSTARMTDLHGAARAERNYAARAGSPGPSAHAYIARDGWILEAIDPARYAAWSNGDVSQPNTANPGVQAVLAFRAKGYNANEAYWEEFELVGFGAAFPVTGAQKQAVAERIAARSKLTGLPLSRRTVHGHWEINGINRQNCPSPRAQHEVFLNDIITRAKAILHPTGATPVGGPGKDVPYAPDVPPEVVALDPSGRSMAVAIQRPGGQYGTVINLIDLEVAMNKAGIDYKSAASPTAGYEKGVRALMAWRKKK